MKAEIIAIGTEILLGEIADTNSSFIAAELPRLGIDLYWISTVGDNRERLIEALQRAWERSDIIFTTGGLGPSEGDITRSTIAAHIGETITLDPGVIERLKARFARSGREMTPSNIKQAGIIPSATFIPNSRGTAPGWWIEKDGRILIDMPGPPGEMHTMWENEVLPRLKKLPTGNIIVSHTLKIWGIPESTLNEMLLPLFSSANPTLAIYVRADGIHIRFAAKAANEEKAREMITPVEEKVRAKLGTALWGEDKDTMEDTLAKLLAEKKLSLAVIEGYTGGLITTTISDTSNTYFKGCLVAGSPEALKSSGINTSFCDDPEGLAGAGKHYFGSDIGLSVTGMESSEGQPASAPDAVYIGIAYGDIRKKIALASIRERARAKRWVVSTALFELIKLLKYETI